jgi:GntR family galactonate operon transcriptional repressor
LDDLPVARLHREKMQLVISDILGGRYPAGRQLPREVSLQHDWQVSRGVVRETMRALEERGIVSVKHGRGATVLPLESWRILDPDVMRAVLAAGSDRRLGLELLEARLLFETDVAALAAQRASHEDTRRLRNALAGLNQTPLDSATERGQAELRLHRLIVDAAGNQAIQQTLAPLLDAMSLLADRLGARRKSPAEHDAIVDAIEARDPEAARDAMRAHLAAAAKSLRRAQPTG